MATQTRHPARAVIRTGFELLLALAVLLPLILAELGINDFVIGGVSLIAVSAGITRVMALPQVEAFLQRFLPWLAAEPPTRQ